jgi:ElaB/YqjD/DUF883 family membrane-anchored ribosome-binding protein
MGSYSSQGAGGGYYDEQSRSNQQTGSSSMRDELNSMKSDLDSLLSKASSLTDRQLRAARDQMMTKFGSMRYSAKDMASEAGKQLNRSMDVTTDYVKDKPLQAVAIAAGIGLLIGALLRRS